MIKVKIDHIENYKDINEEKGVKFYALPDKETRKRIYFLGIKIYDKIQDISMDSNTYLGVEANGKKVGF